MRFRLRTGAWFGLVGGATLASLGWVACGGGMPGGPDGGMDSSVDGIADAATDAAADAGTDDASDVAVEAPFDAGPSPPFTPWFRVYGDFMGSPQKMPATLDAKGALLMTGTKGDGTLDFGGGKLATGAFVAKVDFDANYVYQTSFPLVNAQMGDICIGTCITTDNAGNAYAVGYARGTCDLGPMKNTWGAWLVKLDPMGKVIFAKSYTMQGAIESWSVALDASANIYVAFILSGVSIDFGGGVRQVNGDRIALAKYDANGTYKWDKLWNAGDMYKQLWSVAVDTMGRPIITGTYSGGALDFGGGVLPSGVNAFYVARLDAQGNHVFSKGVASNNGAAYGWLAPDSTGGFFLAGQMDGTMDFGKGNLSSAGGGDAFLARWDSQNQLVFAKRYGDNGGQAFGSLTVDSKDRVIAFGEGNGSVNFGGQNLALTNPRDVFFAKMDGTSAHVASASFSSGDVEWSSAVRRDPWDHQVYIGSFSDPLDLGLGTMMPNGGIFNHSYFVVRVDK